jgi:hypothetical protein
MLKIGTKEVPNVINELTIEQFEKISEITSQELDAFEKWVNIFVFLGADETEVNELEFTEFKEKVKEFNSITYKASKKFLKSFELEGYTYKSHDKKLTISVREMKHIEKIIKNNPNSYISKVIAVLFKRTDLKDQEHYADAHIKHKANLFKKLNAEFTLPYIAFIGEKMKDTAKQINDEVAKELESNNG